MDGCKKWRRRGRSPSRLRISTTTELHSLHAFLSMWARIEGGGEASHQGGGMVLVTATVGGVGTSCSREGVPLAQRCPQAVALLPFEQEECLPSPCQSWWYLSLPLPLTPPVQPEVSGARLHTKQRVPAYVGGSRKQHNEPTSFSMTESGDMTSSLTICSHISPL